MNISWVNLTELSQNLQNPTYLLVERALMAILKLKIAAFTPNYNKVEEILSSDIFV